MPGLKQDSPTTMSAPTLDNPRGKGVIEAAACTLALVAVVAFLRIWGPNRYTDLPGESLRWRLGDYRFWTFLSDITILLSFVS